MYATFNEIRDFLGFPPFRPTNTTRTGEGITGFIEDVIAVLPLEGLTALFDIKMETRELLKTLVRAIQSSVLMVNIHWVYLHVSCCLFYVHTSV